MDEGAIHLFVEVQVKGVERAIGIAEARLLEPSCDEAVLSADEFIADQGRHQVDGGLLLGLGLAQARLEDVGHAGEAELAERVIEFDEIPAGSPVWRSMRSR